IWTVQQPGGQPIRATMGGTSYCFVMGRGDNLPSSFGGIPEGIGTYASTGAFARWPYGDEPIRFSQITDGLSNTLFIGPRPFGSGPIGDPYGNIFTSTVYWGYGYWNGNPGTEMFFQTVMPVNVAYPEIQVDKGFAYGSAPTFAPVLAGPCA